MNCLIVVFALAVCAANASYAPLSVALAGPPAPGVLLKGPASKATIVGPDGSHIVAGADAGAVEAAPKPGGFITASIAPGYVAPAPAYVARAPAYIAPAPAYVAPAPAYVAPAPVKLGTVIDGPSGVIKTKGNPFGVIAAVPLQAPSYSYVAAPAYLGYGYGHGY